MYVYLGQLTHCVQRALFGVDEVLLGVKNSVRATVPTEGTLDSDGLAIDVGFVGLGTLIFQPNRHLCTGSALSNEASSLGSTILS